MATPAVKSRPKPSVNGNHRRTLPVLPAGSPPPVQTSTPPVDAGLYDPAVPIAKIVPSPTNPRKTFDPTYIEELGASIREVGVILPILLRPLQRFVIREKRVAIGSSLWQIVPRGAKEGGVHPGCASKASAEAIRDKQNRELAGKDGEPAYELVVGECRWRACKAAGVETIKATIRELDDRQVREIQLVENLQRKDVDQVEEAEGFQALLEAHDYTAETLAVKLGKSKAHIYAAIKMLSAPPKLLEKVRKGEIPPGIAQLFGRIPGDAARKKAWDEFARSRSEPTVADAKYFIQRECMVELKGSPFDGTNATLTAAGPCTTCPKRTGNAPDLFPEARADVCTDPTCYRAKVEAHGKAAIAAAEAAGGKVLRDKKLFNNYGHGACTLAYNSGFVELDENCYETLKSGTYRKLLGKEAIEKHVTLAIDPKGVVHELIGKQAASRILKEKKLIRTAPKPKSYQPSPKEKLDRQIETEAELRIAAKINEAAAGQVRRMLGPLPPFLRPLLEILLRSSYQFSGAVCDAMERDQGKLINKLAADDDGGDVMNEDPEGDEKKWLAGLADDAIVAVFVEAAMNDLCTGHRRVTEVGAIGAVLSSLGVDREKLVAQVRGELEAAAKNGTNGKAAKR